MGATSALAAILTSALIDTMEDLIVNFIGAVVFSVIGFIYVKNRGKGVSVISRFVPRRKSHDRDYLRLAGGDGDAPLAPGAQAHQAQRQSQHDPHHHDHP